MNHNRWRRNQNFLVIHLTFSGANLFSSFVEDDPLVSDVSLLVVVFSGFKSHVFHLLVVLVDPKNIDDKISDVLEYNLGAYHKKL